MRPPRLSALLLAAGLAGCASYNAMWNAEQHARDARRLERLGQMSDARTQWAQAAAKAGRVSTDKGLALQVEGLSRSGACQDLSEPLARARARVTDQALRERIDLADAECALAAGDAARADAALAGPLASRNVERRSRAEYLAGKAAVARQIMHAARREDLKPIAVELTRLVQAGAEDAAHLLALLTQVQGAAETPGARFRIAELARDSLQASAFAGELFLEAAASDTGSLFAPKALIAALPLLPDARDSIIARLDSRYAGSPYTRAFHGEASLAYVVAEDSLAREMGMQVARGTPLTPSPSLAPAVRLEGPPPVPGRRGPPVDRP